MKVNGHGGKFMVKLGESERSEAKVADINDTTRIIQ